MSLQIGSAAADFALRDQHGQTVRLTDFAGVRNVALVFYPFAFSGICTRELCELRDNIDMFVDRDVQLVGVSCDPVHAQRAWAEAEKYEFPLLSDFWPHGAVAESYGVFDAETGLATRGTFIIDDRGVVRWKVENAIPDARDVSEYRKALAELS